MGKTTDELRKQLADARQKAYDHLAGQVHQYHFADANIDKCSTDRMMASGVILTLSALGGRVIVEPVCIRDGLSKETIEALRADFRRSYLHATSFKPKGL